MSKKIKIVVATFISIVMLTACGAAGDVYEVSGDSLSDVITIPDGAQIDEAIETVETIIAEEEKVPVTVNIYYVKGNFDEFIVEPKELDELTPDALILELAKHNIVPIDTSVKSFECYSNGNDCLELKLSKAFDEYLATMSDEAEEAIRSSIADTFLEAYDADILNLSGTKITWKDTPVSDK